MKKIRKVTERSPVFVAVAHIHMHYFIAPPTNKKRKEVEHNQKACYLCVHVSGKAKNKHSTCKANAMPRPRKGKTKTKPRQSKGQAKAKPMQSKDKAKAKQRHSQCKAKAKPMPSKGKAQKKQRQSQGKAKAKAKPRKK